MYVKTCSCGAMFFTGSVRKRKCDECLKSRHAQSRNIARNARIEASHVKTCAKCNIIFESSNARKLTCKSCDAVERARVENHDVQFIAVDGEGEYFFVCEPNGEIWKQHRYVLLGCGDQQVENRHGLGFEEIFSFLYDQFRQNPKAAYVGFFLGYDFTQWLKNLPEGRAKRLLTKEGIADRRREIAPHLPPFSVLYRGWEFDMLGFKRIKFRPRACECMISGCKHKNPNRWMFICDAGPFFQTTFKKVLADWPGILNDEDYALIEQGKDKRANAHLDDDMRLYNRLENKALASIMAHLNAGLVKVGVRLKANQWFGPGQVAQKWLRLQKECPLRADLIQAVPWLALERARCTYFGGWFEIFMHGIIPGTSYEYDINSAYPYIISKLPCLMHGKWEQRSRDGNTAILSETAFPAESWLGRRPRQEKYSLRLFDRSTVARMNYEALNSAIEAKSSTILPDLPENGLRMVYARLSGADPRIGTMLHRCMNGDIIRPDHTQGWFWQHELDAAQRAGLIESAEYWEWVTYYPCACKPPLRGMTGLYEHRLRVGKNTPEGKSAKLGYNSAYGKFAQTVGDNPVFGNFIYASLITAGCRAMILDAIATHPEGTAAVAMVATDGIYFTSPHPSLPLSNTELGKWDVTKRDNLTLFKPGVYWDDKAREAISEGKQAQFKSRGVNARAFSRAIEDIDLQFRAWNGSYPDDDGWPRITFPLSFSMTTCLQALRGGKWQEAGKVYEDRTSSQNSYPYGKRSPGHYDARQGIYYSAPYLTKPGNRSAPYNKQNSTAALGNESDISASVTPDGAINLLLPEALGLK